ncbi:hypothetical protein ACP3V3_16730 [Vibrio sp. PNB22_3_1]
MRSALPDFWVDHPWGKDGLIEFVPIRLLKLILDSSPALLSNTKDAALLNDPRIWSDVAKAPMGDPLLLVICPVSQTIRLVLGHARVEAISAGGYDGMMAATFLLPVNHQVLGEGLSFNEIGSLSAVEPQAFSKQVRLSDCVHKDLMNRD